MMGLRRSIVEHPFSTIKCRIFGHPRLLLRGRSGASTEIGLAVMAYNIKRMKNVIGASALTFRRAYRPFMVGCRRSCLSVMTSRPIGNPRCKRVSAVSCAGVGSESKRWSEEELRRLELGVVGAFARGCRDAGIAQFCLLSAAGSKALSRFLHGRVMGLKEDTVRNVGFVRLAIFRPGIIVGNAHTPDWVAWLGGLVPGRFGSIDQQTLGRSIAAEIALHGRMAGEVTLENAATKKLAAQFQSVP